MRGTRYSLEVCKAMMVWVVELALLVVEMIVVWQCFRLIMHILLIVTCGGQTCTYLG